MKYTPVQKVKLNPPTLENGLKLPRIGYGKERILTYSRENWADITLTKCSRLTSPVISYVTTMYPLICCDKKHTSLLWSSSKKGISLL